MRPAAARGPMPHEVTLRGRHVVLEPLRAEHAPALAAAVAPDDDVWTWMTSAPRTAKEMEAWIAARQAGRGGGEALAFLQRHPASDAAMGSTSLFDVNKAEESAEIGYTWLAAPYRRTGANTEAKLLLLAYAFETLGLRRVQLVTDARNARSRAAIERVGAKPEGVLRYVRRDREGKLRDSAFFSVVASEWPAVKEALRARLRD